MKLFCLPDQNSTISFISYVCMMLQDAISMPDFMYGLCQAISKDIKQNLDTPNGGTYELAALDIASGYHSYVFKIKEHQYHQKVSNVLHLK